MSKHESWRTQQFWQTVGGLLIEEFHAIPLDRKRGVGRRLIDGVIVLDEPKRRQVGGTFDLQNRDIISVQTKANRLGMYLMGQAYFSREILKRFNPRSIRTVAICRATDPEMKPLCEAADIEVVTIPDKAADIRPE